MIRCGCVGVDGSWQKMFRSLFVCVCLDFHMFVECHGGAKALAIIHLDCWIFRWWIVNGIVLRFFFCVYCIYISKCLFCIWTLLCMAYGYMQCAGGANMRVSFVWFDIVKWLIFRSISLLNLLFCFWLFSFNFHSQTKLHSISHWTVSIGDCNEIQIKTKKEKAFAHHHQLGWMERASEMNGECQSSCLIEL